MRHSFRCTASKLLLLFLLQLCVFSIIIHIMQSNIKLSNSPVFYIPHSALTLLDKWQKKSTRIPVALISTGLSSRMVGGGGPKAETSWHTYIWKNGCKRLAAAVVVITKSQKNRIQNMYILLFIHKSQVLQNNLWNALYTKIDAWCGELETVISSAN